METEIQSLVSIGILVTIIGGLLFVNTRPVRAVQILCIIIAIMAGSYLFYAATVYVDTSPIGQWIHALIRAVTTV